MKTSCIISIFAFFSVSIGMHAQETKTISIGGTDYSGYTINLSSGSGALASFLRSASSDVKSADYIEITGATLGAEDVDALALLNAKFIDLDACTFTDNSLASSITASSNIEAMSLPAGLTKEQVNAAGAKLATTYNRDFGSVASTNTQSVTRDVDAYYVKGSDGYATEEECTNGIQETDGTITGLVPITKTVKFLSLSNSNVYYTNSAKGNVPVDIDSEQYGNIVDGKYAPPTFDCNLTPKYSSGYNFTVGATIYGFKTSDGEFLERTISINKDGDKYYYDGIEVIPILEDEGTVYTFNYNDKEYVYTGDSPVGTVGTQPNDAGFFKFDVTAEYTYTYSENGETKTFTSSESYQTDTPVEITVEERVELVKGTKKETTSESGVYCYVNKAGTLYEATTLADAKESLRVVISGEITLEDLCKNTNTPNVTDHADPGLNSPNVSETYSKPEAEASHYAWNGNDPTCIDLSGVTGIDNVNYLRILQQYKGSVEELYFPPSITSIPDECCKDFTHLLSIDIPDEVTNIGNSAFFAAEKLEYVHIPPKIINIEASAFKRCFSLYYVDFAQGITSLNFERLVFDECIGLKHVSLPEGLTNIGDGTFENCSALRSVRLPSTLNKIGDEAFKGCTKLVSIIIPESVDEIGQAAFPQEMKDVYLMCKKFEDLPVIWTAGATGENNALANSATSTFGSLSLINNKSGNASGVAALAGMTWEAACQDYYDAQYYTDTEGNRISSGMAVLHYPLDFEEDDIETAFMPSISQHYGGEIQGGVKVPIVDHGWDGTNNYSDTFDRELYSDYSRRIRAAEPGASDDPTKSFQSKTGWRQFALIKANSAENELEKKYKEVWYTMCFPFNLDDEQLTEAFGAGFNICEFSGVTAEEIDGEKTIILHFTGKVTEKIPDGGTTGYLAEAFHPYMIHPNYKATNKTMDYTALFRGFKTIAVDEEESEGTNKPSAHSVTKTVTDKNGNEILFDGKNGKYTFIGNVEEVDGKGKKIPYGAYFLGTAKGQTYPKFWRETKTENTAWSQYAAIVIADEAFERNYFEIQEGESWVKGFDFVMDGFESPDGEALSIENIVEDAKTKNLPVEYMNIVYDMNGQMIRKGDAELGDLPSGMYIVNGKKYLVK